MEMDHHQLQALTGDKLARHQVLCPHKKTRPSGIGYTMCVECGSRFAVLYGEG